MYLSSKGQMRLIAPNGLVEVRDVKRIIVGMSVQEKAEYPTIWTKTIKIDTDEGRVELVLEAGTDDALMMVHEGHSIFKAVKKAVTG